MNTSRGEFQSKRPRLAIVLPRGEAYRNFVFTGCLKRLSEAFDLIVFAVRPNDRLFDDLKGYVETVHELEESHRPWMVRFCEEILDMVHGRNLWSEAAKRRWYEQVRRGSFYKRVKMCLKHGLASVLFRMGGLGILSRIHEFLNLCFGVCLRDFEMLKQFRPELVFNASHSHSKNALGTMYAARKLNLSTVTFLFSWDNLTSQGRIYPLYDYYIAWTDRICEDLLRLYPDVDPKRVCVTGTPQFDAHFDSTFNWNREHFCRTVGLDASRPFVLYTTSMSHHFPHERLIIVGIAKMLEKMEEFESPQLFVRLYAKEHHPEYFEDLAKESPVIKMSPVQWERNWQTPLPEDSFVYSNSLRHCAVGINAASTVSLELCMLDKPTINVGYNPPGVDVSPKDYRVYYSWEHYKTVAESGAIDVAWSESEMDRLIRLSLKNPDRLTSDRARFTSAFFGDTLDGKSAVRVAEAVAEFAKDA